MKRIHKLGVLFGVSFLLIACGLLSKPSSDEAAKNGSESSQSVTPTAQESTKTDAVVFPLNPDPINVTATLEIENAVVYKKGGYSYDVETESNDGVLYNLQLLKDMIYMQDENGELAIDSDSKITLTPVSAIEGLPFSQGYEAAVHIGPDGAILLRPGDLTMEIPNEYDTSTLIGFTADNTGDNFHLYPASFESFDGKTYATFKVIHFSLYGVAQVVKSEVVAQQAHPPVEPASQLEQELAPLYSHSQQVLDSYYAQILKQSTRDLSKVTCEDLSKVVKKHNAWALNVQTAGETAFFAERIDLDRTLLYKRLKECIYVTCETCVNPTTDSKPDKDEVQKMLNRILLAQELGVKLKLGDETLNNWALISSKCAKSVGIPFRGAGIAADASGGSQTATCQE
jgi:hypothetical protein